MSWTIVKKLQITAPEVDEILDALNAHHPLLDGKWTRQDWGWSAECDISISGRGICFSGAEFSRGTDLPDRFMAEAKRRGIDG